MRAAARELVVLLAREAARLALEREAAAENETTRTGDKPVRAEGGRERERPDTNSAAG